MENDKNKEKKNHKNKVDKNEKKNDNYSENENEKDKKELAIVHSENDFTVKPVALMYFENPSLSVHELKILEEILFEMGNKSQDEEFVEIAQKRIEKILGVSEVKRDTLDRYIKNISTPVSVKGQDGQFVGIGLVDKYGWINGARRQKILKLRPTPTLNELYETIGDEGKQYFRYKTMISDYLTTTYAIWLASYIIQNIFRKTWKVKEQELKRWMNCYAKRYKTGSYFRYEVLNPSIEQINSSGLIKVEYSYETTGKETVYTFYITENLLLTDSKKKKEENTKVISTVEELRGLLSEEQLEESIGYIRLLYPHDIDPENRLLMKYQRAQLHANTDPYEYMLKSLKNELGINEDSNDEL